MRYFLPLVFLLALAASVPALSVQDVGRLAELKTSDELVLNMLSKEGLDKPLTTADVIYLREHGASEKVIQYMLKLSESQPSGQQAVQDGSEKVSDNLRSYTTTTKSGKQVRVVTNLDENGKRMGGPVPPPPPDEPPAPYTPPPQEVRVTVTEDRPLRDDGGYEEPEPYEGPVYEGEQLYPYSYPYAYPYPIYGGHYGHHHGNGQPGNHVRMDGSVHIPQRPSAQPSQAPPPKTAALPVRPRR